MLITILSAFFVLSALLLILLVFIQKSKSSLGLGAMGGGTQLLFGGSGGQDIFQKTTWALGALLLGGSLALSWAKTQQAAHDGTRVTRPLHSIPPAQADFDN